MQWKSTGSPQNLMPSVSSCNKEHRTLYKVPLSLQITSKPTASTHARESDLTLRLPGGVAYRIKLPALKFIRNPTYWGGYPWEFTQQFTPPEKAAAAF